MLYKIIHLFFSVVEIYDFRWRLPLVWFPYLESDVLIIAVIDECNIYCTYLYPYDGITLMYAFFLHLVAQLC